MRIIDADALIKRCMNEIDNEFIGIVNEIPTIDTKPLIHCKNCKYFEYDSVANVDGVSLIVAHEICKRWGVTDVRQRKMGIVFWVSHRKERNK